MNILPIDFSGLYQPHKVAFERYRDLLIKWNQRFNLTSIDRPEEIHELHFLDSIALLAILSHPFVSRETFSDENNRGSILDIGSGAGFPGIPIKIIRPEIRLTLVDSVKKKCDFTKEVVRSIGLSNVEIIHKRLTGSEQIGQFDIVVSRAAFKMPDIIKYAVNNLRKGGLIVGMKAAPRSKASTASEGLPTALATARKGSQREKVLEEISGADPILKRHNLSPIEQYYYTLPVSGKTRSLLITRKA